MCELSVILFLVVLGHVKGGSSANLGSNSVAAMGPASDDCRDIQGKKISHESHFIPDSDNCKICVCEHGLAKRCKTVLCRPPQDCKSFEIGSNCCEFICMDGMASGTDRSGVPGTGTSGADFFNI